MPGGNPADSHINVAAALEKDSGSHLHHIGLEAGGFPERRLWLPAAFDFMPSHLPGLSGNPFACGYFSRNSRRTSPASRLAPFPEQAANREMRGASCSCSSQPRFNLPISLHQCILRFD